MAPLVEQCTMLTRGERKRKWEGDLIGSVRSYSLSKHSFKGVAVARHSLYGLK